MQPRTTSCHIIPSFELSSSSPAFLAVHWYRVRPNLSYALLPILIAPAGCTTTLDSPCARRHSVDHPVSNEAPLKCQVPQNYGATRCGCCEGRGDVECFSNRAPLPSPKSSNNCPAKWMRCPNGELISGSVYRRHGSRVDDFCPPTVAHSDIRKYDCCPQDR